MRLGGGEPERLGIDTAEDVDSSLAAIAEVIVRLDNLYGKIDLDREGYFLTEEDTELLKQTFKLYLQPREDSVEMSAVCARGALSLFEPALATVIEFPGIGPTQPEAA